MKDPRYKPQSLLCIRKNTKHGLGRRGHRNKFYTVWLSMKNRCYNPKCKDFKHYGAKGITVCALWVNSPEVFVAWCMSQPQPPGRAVLDRKEAHLGYSPYNCRLTSDAVSVRNRSMSIWVEIDGQKLVLKDAVAKYGAVSYSCAKVRVRERRWKPIDAVLRPAHSVIGRIP